MRTIKFRAWDKKKIINWDDLLKYYGDGESDYDLHAIFSGDEHLGLMQFTGLLDKNGKEIYEGDIVKFYDTTIPDDIEFIDAIPMVCQFEDNGFNFYGNGDARTGALNNDDKDFREIIGNIYENPKLFK